MAPALPADPVDPGADACGASRLQYLIGQPESVLDGMRFDAPVRVIRPGMAVTMDYRPDRLNIEIDARNRIARVHCS
nr:I78 family peptidase inhibitor [Phaeovulum sp. NW3]